MIARVLERKGITMRSLGNLQGSGASGVTLWKQDLGGDQGDSQGPDGIPPSGGTPDNRDDR